MVCDMHVKLYMLSPFDLASFTLPQCVVIHLYCLHPLHSCVSLSGDHYAPPSLHSAVTVMLSVVADNQFCYVYFFFNWVCIY